ncbi:hypothetical protein ACQZV8_09045 [Magnetococcales bacterium HHB-1]
MQQKKTLSKESGLPSKVLASMSYLGILALVPMVLNRDDSYVNFHARQGIIIWMWEVIAIYCLFLPGIGRLIFVSSSFLCLLFSIIGLISVFLNRAWRLPIVGTWVNRY